MYVYQETERFRDDDGFTHILYTVGFYRPDGKWIPEFDTNNKDEAAKRVAWLNGKSAANGALSEALNMGNGIYKP